MLTLRAANLAPLTHGFFGRQGGVSTGLYASLNCGPGSGDAPAAVAENRKRVADALGAKALVTLHQVHSAEVVTVRAPWAMGEGAKADAMVSASPGIALGILTADCAPVLFADTQAGVIGAAHAGWKGAIGGVTDATIAAMEKLGATRAAIAAAIGPCISQENYEVGREFRNRFLDGDTANEKFFAPSDRPDRFRFALESYVAHRLRRAGLGRIKKLSACTYAREVDFFSFRRATHQGESDYGREISAVLLP